MGICGDAEVEVAAFVFSPAASSPRMLLWPRKDDWVPTVFQLLAEVLCAGCVVMNDYRSSLLCA